ncbi:hypothetical protein TNCV_1174261 [Trichonephila clavipes]|nr:hypothetical protein TNCV_1174261 [Trichonephila clavipes]
MLETQAKDLVPKIQSLRRVTPPITNDDVKNQAALLKHLQDITKQKLQAQLLGTRMKIFLQTPYAYHTIRRYVDENQLESHTFMLPEEKKLRAVIRGLPIVIPTPLTSSQN